MVLRAEVTLGADVNVVVNTLVLAVKCREFNEDREICTRLESQQIMVCFLENIYPGNSKEIMHRDILTCFLVTKPYNFSLFP